MRRLILATLLLFSLAGCARITVHAADDTPCGDGTTNCYAAGSRGLTQQQREGRDAWYFWTGGDTNAAHEVVGDQVLWRALAVQSHGTYDLLQALDSRMRNQRFHRWGVMNDPDCAPAAAADKYGLWLDDCAHASPTPKDTGEATGVIGLRRFLNPRFNAAAWDVDKYRKDPASVEPPYIIGMACAFCHVGPHPLHPPTDPEHPQWQNLHAGVGNQYLREELFHTAKYPAGRGLTPHDFLWQAMQAELPGTADTSQVATDHLHDPGTINMIAGLNSRPLHDEITADGVPRKLYLVLKDGADSVGSACLGDHTARDGDMSCAAMRGYINIGVCGAYFLSLHDPVLGLARRQAAFDPEAAKKFSPACAASWKATAARLPSIEAFLRTFGPVPLERAPEGSRWLTHDDATLQRGKLAFANECARCHSSKQPPADILDKAAWYRKSVLRPDFLEGNYLSDDARHPVTEIGTNTERAMASNAIDNRIWSAFSSSTYKKQPAVFVRDIPNPTSPLLPKLSVTATDGRGYYRTPSLIGIWSSAPFLHNNALGAFNADPSVAGRLAAYNDAMDKLLWPSHRLNRKSIERTTQPSVLRFPEGGKVCIARGTPTSIVTNVATSPSAWMRKPGWRDDLLCPLMNTGLLNSFFITHDTVADVVQDRGHTFGSQFSDADKRALIEYMKTF